MTKLTALTELTAVDPADLLYIVDDPSGTPTGKKATALNVVSDTLESGTIVSVTASGALTAAGATINGPQTLYKATNDTMLKIETAGNNRTFSVWSATNGGYISAWNGAGTENVRLDGRASSSNWVLNKLGINQTSPSAQLHVVNGTASQPALIAKAHASQADNIIEIQTSGGAIQFGIGVSGQILTNQDSANTNTPSGATAHQLPIYNEAGTLLGYIPVYASAW